MYYSENIILYGITSIITITQTRFYPKSTFFITYILT